MRHVQRVLILMAILAVCMTGNLQAQIGGPVVEDDSIIILDTVRSFWRFRTVWETEDIAMDDGSVQHVRFNVKNRNWYRENPSKVVLPDDGWSAEKAEMVRIPAQTSDKWMEPNFDDSTWVRSRGPVFRGSNDKNWKLILARGRFEVIDPQMTQLKLRLTFRGGAVVYFNGKEIHRSQMPEGDITPDSPALPYPPEIYVDSKGFLAWPHDNKKEWDEKVKQQYREVNDLKIPRDMIVKGVNVLAVAIHRAPGNKAQFIRRVIRYPEADSRAYWARCSLDRIQLLAVPGSQANPNISRVPDKGFVAWNHSIMRRTFPSDYPDPFAKLQPIRMAGVRNGTFAGQIMLGHEEAIEGLKAVASDLVGPAGKIPASAVTIRWGVPDGPSQRRGELGAFDSLEDNPPKKVPVYKQLGESDVGYGATGGAVQPVWINVHVPADAAGGLYRGKVTVTADGLKAIEVPVEINVIEWTLPTSEKMSATMDIVQSPESLALAYGVELWSDEHFKLLDRTFSLLAPLSVKTLYITAVRRTHFGNEDAMIRFVRDSEGDLQPDFSIMEKYLDVATKHLGKVPGVVLYCWEPTSSMGHASGTGTMGRTNDRPILITVKSGDKLRKMKGPAWGTPECKAFWKRLTTALKATLAKRGMGDSLIFGLMGDNRPTQQAMDDVTTDYENPRWAVHSHHFAKEWKGYPVGFCSALWGIGCTPMDPATHRSYGWQNPFWLVYYPREMSHASPLVDFRTKLESWMYAVSRTYSYPNPDPTVDGTHGLGRLGADFWTVLKDNRGNARGSLAGRYPESYWGQLNMNYCIPHLLGQGVNGAVPTVRSEMFRENIQEIEARIAIERALLAYEKKADLGRQVADLDAKIAELDKQIADEKSDRNKARFTEARDKLKTGRDAAAAELDKLGKTRMVGDELYQRSRDMLDRRIRVCLHAQGEGLSWFISSDWNKRTENLFELAAEVDKAVNK